jgi:hypothetical protein
MDQRIPHTRFISRAILKDRAIFYAKKITYFWALLSQELPNDSGAGYLPIKLIGNLIDDEVMRARPDRVD